MKEAIKNICFLHSVLYEFSAIPEKSRLWFIFVDVFINDQKRFGFSNSESLSLVTWAFFVFEVICFCLVS